jgi:hypothetical protein
VTNSLAYYDKESITTVKMFYDTEPWQRQKAQKVQKKVSKCQLEKGFDDR